MLRGIALFAAACAAVIFVFWDQRRKQRLGRLASLRAQWGKRAVRRRELRPGFQGTSPLRLDDQAWADLDLDAVFALLDRTLTEPGQQVLHELLRTPLTDVAALQRRSQAITELLKGPEDLQQRLLPLADVAQGVLVPALQRDLPTLPLPALAYRALSVLAVAMLGAFAVSPPAGFVAALLAFVVNMAAHYHAQQQLAAALPAVTALQELFATAQRIVSKALPGLEPEQAAVKRALDALRPLAEALGGVVPVVDDSLSQYINIYLLRQERLFARAAPLLAERRVQAAELLQAVGMLDALQSLASWRSSETACAPVLRDGPLAAQAVRHPLVPECIPNDVQLDQGLLVTGSNMSGKSTYLRAVALNALFAQTIYCCLAKSWQGPAVRLMTCIRRADSVLAGRSYYLSEAQGILDIVKAAPEEPRVLCVLDEIFRGTNSLERIAAASAVLKYLATHGALVLAATHDHPLTEQLTGLYVNAHFSERVGSAGLEFDFLLKPGPATTSNAIALLQHLGYPPEIIEQALSKR